MLWVQRRSLNWAQDTTGCSDRRGTTHLPYRKKNVMPATALQPGHAPLRRIAKIAVFGALALLTIGLVPGTSAAATDPGLGTADAFAVLGAGTVTNTGPTVVNGDLGVHAGNAVTGFEDADGGPGVVNGAIHAGDATAADAYAAAEVAYDALADQDCDEDRTGEDLGGLTLTPGVYCFSTSAQLTNALTLNAIGDPNAVFVFRVGTALTTASSSSVVFTDDFASCNVFWQVGSAAILGTDTDFVGTVITRTEAITANTRATVRGRLLALNAAVTLDSNVITATSCEPPVGEPVVDEPAADEPAADEPAADEVPAGDGSVDELPEVDDQVGDTPAVDTSVDDPSSEAGPSGVTPVGSSPVDEVPTDVNRPQPDAVRLVVPGSADGPFVRVPPFLTPEGPDGPPTLPVTGSNVLFGGLGFLGVAVGTSMVLLARPSTSRGSTERF